MSRIQQNYEFNVRELGKNFSLLFELYEPVVGRLRDGLHIDLIQIYLDPWSLIIQLYALVLVRLPMVPKS